MSTEPPARSNGHSGADQPIGLDRALIQAAMRDAVAVAEHGSSAGRGSPLISVERFASPASDSFPGYEITREIHRGGQGIVYQAIQKTTRRKVAIKVMREGPLATQRDRARFEREVHILSQLKHPNIVAIHDSGEVGQWSFHVMDYISGQPLDVYIASKRMPIPQIVALFKTICEAINVAHLRGIVHRDLKPSNIRIDPGGQPHILDFGLAKVSEFDVLADHSPPVMTITGQFVGSLPWASPEQAEGNPTQIDIRTDVYSLGVLLFQMLTGHFPYEVAGPMRQVLDEIIRVQPPRPGSLRREIDDELDTIVLKCLHKDPIRRYQSAGELARDLDRYLKGDPIEAKRDSVAYLLRKTLGRYRIRAAVVAAFIVLTLASTVSFFVLYQDAQFQAVAAAQQRDRAEAQAAKLRAALTVFSGIVSSVAMNAQPDEDNFAMLSEANRQARTEFADDPEISAKLHYALAIGYFFLNYADRTRALTESRQHAHEAWAIQQRTLGPDHPETLRTARVLIIAAAAMLDFDEAEKIGRQQLELIRRSKGPRHIETLATLAILGGALRDAGKLAESEHMVREALTIAEQDLGPFESRTRYIRMALISTLCVAKRFDEAEAIMLAVHREVMAQEPINRDAAIHTLDVLTSVYHLWGEPDLAEEYRLKSEALSKTPAKTP